MAVTQDNRVAVAVDILDDHADPEFMDFLSAKGYVLALNLACRTAIGGQAVAAPICSSWIWLCRASTKRTLMQPLGNPASLSIRQGNLMVSRLILLLMILMSRGMLATSYRN